ncbi:MAG: YigZ family protein [Lachnospiraceae bacterium]|nr:YigZ family protein [Lachnospiraceae bacterium]
MKKLITPAEGNYVEKKSKFICHLFKVTNQDEIQEILKAEKKKYFDAKHHCYAFVYGETGANVKCSDDGEPSGTAGKPMLEILQREGLTDILCVVTRYFGGTLLGTGGLVRAYSESLKDALENSTFADEIPAFLLEYRYSYNFDAIVASYFRDKNIKVLNTEYTDSVSVKIVISQDIYEKTNDDLKNLTKGSIEKTEETKCMYAL